MKANKKGGRLKDTITTFAYKWFVGEVYLSVRHLGVTW
jgi:hypothetical protein